MEVKEVQPSSVEASSLTVQQSSDSCWQEPLTYDLCCSCGNAAGNLSGTPDCFDDTFTFDRCCIFFGEAASLPNIPCWRDGAGVKTRLRFDMRGKQWTVFQYSTDSQPGGVGALMGMVLWPSAYAMSLWLMDKPHSTLVGKRIMELGCGVGLPAIVAAELGAEVTGTELKRQGTLLAAAAAKRNLPLAAQKRIDFGTLDFMDLESVRAHGKFDVVLMAGPIICLPHTMHMVEPLIHAVRLLCKQECDVILTMGGSRQFDPRFFYLFPPAFRFVDLLQLEFRKVDEFVCSDRGYATQRSGMACMQLARLT